MARKRRGGEGTDLVSKLVNTTPRDGVPLSAQDFDNYFLLLVVAGNETTRHTITHSMLALLQHPEQLARLQADPSLIPGAVEEFLRWASPVYHFRRTATREVELGGKLVREGDKVVMWYASGNRDEAVFANPYDFDVTRTDNDHLTFGKGSPHLCLGNLLARTEIRIMFEELIPRLADIRLVGMFPGCARTSSTGSRSCRSRSPSREPLSRRGRRAEGTQSPVRGALSAIIPAQVLVSRS